MGHNRDMKRRGQPQNVSLLLSSVYISPFLGLLTVTVFPVAMVTSVAEHSKDSVAVMRISREDYHYLVIPDCAKMLPHNLGKKSN